MREEVSIKNWRLAYIPNADVCKKNISLKTPEEVQSGGYPILSATVPGGYEIDFMREGLLDDIYYGTNVLQTQKLENLHFYYFTDFTYEAKENCDAFLCFEGIDTVAEIFLDGEKIGFVENMFHAHRFSLKNVASGKHTLLVHIIPATIHARQFELPAVCYGMKYNTDSLSLRKASAMFGWDIMPRIISAGLWKAVKIEYLSKVRIVNPHVYTAYLMGADLHSAWIKTALYIQTDADFITDYTIEIKGKCGDSTFYHSVQAFTANIRFGFELKNPKLWWPKNYGEPNLYDVDITLLYKGVECDKVQCRLGVRTIWLKRTSQLGDNGDFCFIINWKKVFVLGTNWVSCDAIPSRHDEYTLRNIEMVDDLQCNMIRCWGGNVYPSDVLYDYCDEHGIMIWQDFGMACGHYADDERICRLVGEEAREIILSKRQHPSLVVWAGDNECDGFIVGAFETARTDNDPPAFVNPNQNKLTREIIARELRNHDGTRPYLPSSPYLDEISWRYGAPSELHLWGPRDFFKGDYYCNAECHFVSEIGYHGCPSPQSIKKFIPQKSLPKSSIAEIYENPDWLVHAACMEASTKNNPYAYRLPLMVSQVERIFGKASGDLNEYARQSQISQAEAKKFFIESFRVAKWRKTGILWWNIVDGWPQISDAVVDWYGCKKLAYHYIKRSQQPLCMLCDEPKDGEIKLFVANDTQTIQSGEYTVTELISGQEVAKGSFSVEANGLVCVDSLPDKKKAFYLMRWRTKTEKGINHFVCNIGEGWTYETYCDCMKKAGFYQEFEGF